VFTACFQTIDDQLAPLITLSCEFLCRERSHCESGRTEGVQDYPCKLFLDVRAAKTKTAPATGIPLWIASPTNIGDLS
jgi:hypothetical protein